MQQARLLQVPNTFSLHPSRQRLRNTRSFGYSRNTARSSVADKSSAIGSSAVWKEFAQAASGEWSGVTATYNSDGVAHELPYQCDAIFSDSVSFCRYVSLDNACWHRVRLHQLWSTLSSVLRGDRIDWTCQVAMFEPLGLVEDSWFSNVRLALAMATCHSQAAGSSLVF